MKITLSSQVGDGQPQYGEPVELGQNVLLEGQEVGQGVQLGVQSLSMPLAGIAFRDAVFRRGFQTATQMEHNLSVREVTLY